MLKKLLASIGIGAARVDTQLYSDVLMPGEVVQGEIQIRGGDVPQEVDTLSLYLITHYVRESGDSTIVEKCQLGRYPVVQRFVIEPNESRSFPFNIQLPYQTPLTFGRRPVYLHTDLEIANSVDPGDTDYIQVRPHPLQQRVLEALQELGFQLYQVENEYNRRWTGPYPFVQEFEFKPGYSYSRQLEELEVIFSLHPHGLDVLLEIDKRLRGLARLFEDFDLNERYARLQLTNTDLQRPDLAQVIQRVIQQRISS